MSKPNSSAQAAQLNRQTAFKVFSMPIFSRLSYAAVLLMISIATLMLLFACIESAGVTPDVDFEDIVRHPAYILGVLGIGFFLAPHLSRRFPVAGEPVEARADGKPRMRYEVRVVLFAVLAIVLSIVALLLAMTSG